MEQQCTACQDTTCHLSLLHFVTLMTFHQLLVTNDAYGTYHNKVLIYACAMGYGHRMGTGTCVG